MEHASNVHWDIDDDTVNLGVEVGSGEFTADPQSVDFDGGDYHLLAGSPAHGRGVMNDGTVEEQPSESQQWRDFEPVEEDNVQ